MSTGIKHQLISRFDYEGDKHLRMGLLDLQGSLARFFIVLLILLLLANCTTAKTSIVQVISSSSWISSAVDRSSSKPPPEPPICKPPQPRYDIQCYETLANHTLDCDTGLGGLGSLETLCKLKGSITLPTSSIIVGSGSLEIPYNMSVSCAKQGCEIIILLHGDLKVGSDSSIVGGTVTIQAAKVLLGVNSSINATALGGSPPPQTSGTPQNLEGAGGGHGGRGASCERDEGKDQSDTWGGDMYKFETLSEPWSYGSSGGTTSELFNLGGLGGGRIGITVVEILELNGTIEANGGSVREMGGGGSGGSILIKAPLTKGDGGKVSVSGGTGRGGGGGGRIAIDCPRFENVDIFFHGGESLGCPQNAGAAGTRFDVLPKSLLISNEGKNTKTDTVLLEFPLRFLWGNVIIEKSARVGVPLLWSRVQVFGDIKLLSGSSLSFGLARYPTSEFELMADAFFMENSRLMVYGALRMTTVTLVMTNSVVEIIASLDDSMVLTSTMEASSLALLKKGSEIRSNANLGIHGQGLLKLAGSGDCIKAQRLFLSLFYNVMVGPGAILQAPLKENSPIKDELTRKYCGSIVCPAEVLSPSEDCTLNVSSPFSLQVHLGLSAEVSVSGSSHIVWKVLGKICRVEDIHIHGNVSGSVVHIQRSRTVTVSPAGVLLASALGCHGGLGEGNYTKGGAGGGGGHGGRGGRGELGGIISLGGAAYGSKEFPCELGSGSGTPGHDNPTAGGGLLVLGSLEHPVARLDVYGVLAADGESSIYIEPNSSGIEVGGPGGGSGGSLLLFLQTLTLANGSRISSVGGHGGSVGAGGGGGGRVHFHWSNIPSGEDFVPIASGDGFILASGGIGRETGLKGEDGTISGKPCPRGLHGLFCEECPVGTYKNETGSAQDLCKPCPPEKLPHRARYTYVRGGVAEPKCPYQCTSEKYRMPNCFTMLEDLIYTLGGPYLFTLLLSCVMVVLALVLSVARMKLVGNDDFSGPSPLPQGAHIDHSFPFLESLNEVLETTRVEESQCHIHRMYFMGSNSFGEPWHLPHCPPEQIIDLIYEDAFNRFVVEVNGLAAYQWWEGSVHSILTAIAYPFAWSWQQWRRRLKIQRLREFVRSEYDHGCLRSCRSRALYEGLKVAATPDLMLAYIDVFLGGDEKRPDLPPKLMQRLPMSIIFGGDGSYMAPYNLHTDNLLTSLLAQAMPSTMFYRMVAGLNAQLHTVRQGSLNSSLSPVISWINTHANPWLSSQSLRVDLAWFQATASGYYQLGLVLNGADEIPQYLQPSDMLTLSRSSGSARFGSYDQLDGEGRSPRLQHWHLSPSYSSMGASRRHIGGATLDNATVRSLEDRHNIFLPLSLLLRSTRPVGHQASVGLVIILLLLVDLCITLLMLLQLYSISLEAVFLVVLVLPLAPLLSSAAGLNALFIHGPSRSAGLARVYALWNLTSILNALVAFIIGFLHYYLGLGPSSYSVHRRRFNSEEDSWWLFPALLILIKFVQAQMIGLYVANLDVKDQSLYATDPIKFWES